MLAKICSDINKPNGQSYLKPNLQTILDFMENLPLRKVPHIGGMRESTLNEMGIKTCLDLRKRATELLIAFSEIESTFFIRCSLGIGQTTHNDDEYDGSDEQKGISVSETFKPLRTLDQFKQKLCDLIDELVKRMAAKQLCGRVVLIGLKTTDFN